MTVALFLGHNNKPSFHLQLWTEWKSLSFLACSCRPLHKESWFCFWSSFSRWAQILQQSASNLWFIMYYTMCLECCYHHQTYAALIIDSTHIFHIFTRLTSWWRTWTFKTPSWSLVTQNMNTIQSLYCTHGVVIKGFYKRSGSLRSYFPKFQTKPVANSLLFMVCHFTKLWQSQKACNMNTLKCQLQNITLSYNDGHHTNSQ